MYVMQIYQILRLVFLVSVSTPIITITIYATILFYYYITRKYKYAHQKRNITNPLPKITILIPTHNEEKVISKRIENIFESYYPNEKIKVIFIDDSADSTSDIIQEYVNIHENMHLIKFDERMGYSPSILAGVHASNTDIIVLNEAGSFPQPDALLKLINHFENLKIGAVSGRSEILNQDEKTGKMESLYLKITNFIRESESYLDSTFYIKGEAMAVRRSLVSNIKSSPLTGSIDTSMAFFVRKKGYKCIYDPEVVFDEFAPSNSTGWIKQKTTRAANWMRNITIYKDMIFNLKYGKFGCITLPFNIVILFIFPFFPFIMIASILIGIYFDPAFFLRIAIVTGISALLTIILEKKIFFLFIKIEISLLNALYQIFISKKSHDKIDQVESTRKIALEKYFFFARENIEVETE